MSHMPLDLYEWVDWQGKKKSAKRSTKIAKINGWSFRGYLYSAITLQPNVGLRYKIRGSKALDEIKKELPRLWGFQSTVIAINVKNGYLAVIFSVEKNFITMVFFGLICTYWNRGHADPTSRSRDMDIWPYLTVKWSL